MAKNYFNRYVWLIETIHRYGHITLKDISRKWERSALNDDGEPLAERTFHNHRLAIEESFGIELRCDRSLGYYIANPDEIGDGGVREWLLESISLNNMLNEAGSLRDRILFENTAILCWTHCLTPVAEADGLWKVKFAAPSTGAFEDFSIAVAGVRPFLFLSPDKFWHSR